MSRKISRYIESTYLKTADELSISEEENKINVIETINNSIKYDFFLVMIRSKYLLLAKKIIQDSKKDIKIGTVIDFPLGESSTKKKLSEASYAIENYARCPSITHKLIINYKIITPIK